MAKNKKIKKKDPPSSPQKQQQQIQQARAQLQVHEGPLPAPDVFGQYDQIVPGAAERIIAMAESQANHRQKLELIAVKSGSRDSLLGLIFGLIIGLSAIIGSVLTIMSGKEQGGAALGITGLASLVGVFVYGSRQRRLEREAKMQRVNSHPQKG